MDNIKYLESTMFSTSQEEMKQFHSSLRLDAMVPVTELVLTLLGKDGENLTEFLLIKLFG